MSVFRSMAAQARAAHDHFFGSTATLAEPGQSVRTVDVVLGRETTETRREDNRDVRVTVRQCRFLSVTSVRDDAIVTVGSLRYAIDDFVDRQASGLTVRLRRTAVTDSNRPSYRGKG